MTLCPAPNPDMGLVLGLLQTVDCNIREGVQGGYQALFGSGSLLGLVLSAILTLYIAWLGFSLMMGRGDIRFGDLPVIGLKIGAIILLSNSWANYQTLVFDVLFNGPAEIADKLLANAPMPANVDQSFLASSGNNIFIRLDAAFRALTDAASALANTLDQAQGAARVIVQTPNNGANITPIVQMRSALQGGPAFGATALWLSAITMLIGTLGLLILAKLMLGLLLALGPLFVGMLLFENTKGFFEGWLRTALGFAFMPLATIIFLAALLASIDPSLSALVAAQQLGRYDLNAVMTILILVMTFTLVFATVMGLSMRLMGGFRLAVPKRVGNVIEASVPSAVRVGDTAANGQFVANSNSARALIGVANGAVNGAVKSAMDGANQTENGRALALAQRLGTYNGAMATNNLATDTANGGFSGPDRRADLLAEILMRQANGGVGANVGAGRTNTRRFSGAGAANPNKDRLGQMGLANQNGMVSPTGANIAPAGNNQPISSLSGNQDQPR